MQFETLQIASANNKHLKDVLQIIFERKLNINPRLLLRDQLPLHKKWWRMNYYINSWKYNMPVYRIPIEERFGFIFNILGELTKNCVIAGGALNDEFNPEDIDIFILNFTPEIKKKLVDIFIKNGAEFRTESMYAVSLELDNKKIQIVKRDYKSPKHIINSFDHSICKVAYYEKYLYFTIDYYFAKMTKSISINYKLNGIGYMYRLKKYQDKGIAVICPEIENVDLPKLRIKVHVVEYIDPESNYSLYGLDHLYIRNGVNAILEDKIDKCTMMPIELYFDDKIKLHLMEKYKCYISEKFIEEKKIEFGKIIQAREKIIQDHYDGNIPGRPITYHNNPTMTVEQFYRKYITDDTPILSYVEPQHIIYMQYRLTVVFYIKTVSLKYGHIMPKFLIIKILDYIYYIEDIKKINISYEEKISSHVIEEFIIDDGSDISADNDSSNN